MTMMEQEQKPVHLSQEDASSRTTANAVNNSNNKQSKETRQPFPVKVYEMLQDADPKGFSHIVSWNQAGNGFMVYKKDLFINQVVPQYFNQSRYKSFQRQLSLYGFQRVTAGPNKGLRHHEKLRKGCHDFACQMKPVGYKPRGTTKILERQQQQSTTVPNTLTLDHSRCDSSPMTVDAGSGPVSVIANRNSIKTSCIPSVISSNSLDKQGQSAGFAGQETSSPITQEVQEHSVISEGEESSSEDHLDEEMREFLDTGLFEGMNFFLMDSTQDLLDEFLPVTTLPAKEPSIAQASLPPPGMMDAELKKAWESGYSTALYMGTQFSDTAAPPTQEDRMQQERAQEFTSSPGLFLEGDCVDALDFHAATIAATNEANIYW